MVRTVAPTFAACCPVPNAEIGGENSRANVADPPSGSGEPSPHGHHGSSSWWSLPDPLMDIVGICRRTGPIPDCGVNSLKRLRPRRRGLANVGYMVIRSWITGHVQ